MEQPIDHIETAFLVAGLVDRYWRGSCGPCRRICERTADSVQAVWLQMLCYLAGRAFGRQRSDLNVVVDLNDQDNMTLDSTRGSVDGRGGLRDSLLQ